MGHGWPKSFSFLLNVKCQRVNDQTVILLTRDLFWNNFGKKLRINSFVLRRYLRIQRYQGTIMNNPGNATHFVIRTCVGRLLTFSFFASFTQYSNISQSTIINTISLTQMHDSKNVLWRTSSCLRSVECFLVAPSLACVADGNLPAVCSVRDAGYAELYLGSTSGLPNFSKPTRRMTRRFVAFTNLPCVAVETSTVSVGCSRLVVLNPGRQCKRQQNIKPGLILRLQNDEGTNKTATERSATWLLQAQNVILPRPAVSPYL